MSKIQIARSLVNQHDYENAAIMYSEILIQMEGHVNIVDENQSETEFIKRKKLDEGEVKNQNEECKDENDIPQTNEKASILIEYSHSLVKNAINYFDSIIANAAFANMEPSSTPNVAQITSLINKRAQIESDLQIAWESLESSRLFFICQKNHSSLAKIAFLQGEINLINENWNDAIDCYLDTLDSIEKINKDSCQSTQNDENPMKNIDHDPSTFKYVTIPYIYMRIADSYTFLSDTKNATVFLLKAKQFYIQNIHDKHKLTKKLKKIEKLISDLEIDDDHPGNEIEQNVVDVNHLKKKKE